MGLEVIMKHHIAWKGDHNMEDIKVSELIRDDTLYPRERVDWAHVQQMIDAAEAGATFPPIIACRRTKRIVDGRHRVEMTEKACGTDATVAVIFKTYATDEEYFLDAVRYNSQHGLTLSKEDKIHILCLASRLQISTDLTAAALSTTVNAAGKLHIACITGKDAISTPTLQLKTRFAPVSTPAPTKTIYSRLPTEGFDSPVGRDNRPDSHFVVGPLDCVINWLKDASAADCEATAIKTRLKRLNGLLDQILNQSA
jgi:hypothetical protein